MSRTTKLLCLVLALASLAGGSPEAVAQPTPGWLVGPGDAAGEAGWSIFTLQGPPVIDGDRVTFRSTIQHGSIGDTPSGIYQHAIGAETRQLQRDAASQPYTFLTNLAQDGARVAYGTFNGEVVLVSEDDPLASPELLGSASFLRWVSLDGGTAAWQGDGPSTLYVRAAADAAPRSVTGFSIAGENLNGFTNPFLRGDSLAAVSGIHAQRAAALLIGTDLTTVTPLFYIWTGDGVPTFPGTSSRIAGVSQLVYDGRYVAFTATDSVGANYGLFRKDTQGGAAGELLELAHGGQQTPGRAGEYAFDPFTGGQGLHIPCIDDGNVVFMAGSHQVVANPDLPANIAGIYYWSEAGGLVKVVDTLDSLPTGPGPGAPLGPIHPQLAINPLLISRECLSGQTVVFGGFLFPSGPAAIYASDFTPQCDGDAACDDGLPCTVDTCVDGTCQNPIAADGTSCPDPDPGDCWEAACEAGVCEALYEPHPDGTACGEDVLFCNGEEACLGGTCASGLPPCPAGGCDESLDACVPSDTDVLFLLESSFAGEDRLGLDGASDMDVNDFVIDIGGCAVLAETGDGTAVSELVYVYNGRHVGALSVDNAFFHTVPAPWDPANAPDIECVDTVLGGTALDPATARSPAASEDRGFVQFPVYASTRHPFDGLAGFIYTDPSLDTLSSGNRVTECTVRFPVPVPMSLDAVLGDPFLNRLGTGLRGGGVAGTAVEVHAYGHAIAPFFTADVAPDVTGTLENGAPAAVLVPLPGWAPPTERTDIVLAYPDLLADPDGPWYETPVDDESLVFERDAGGELPPPFRFPDGSRCAAPTGGCEVDSDCATGSICFAGECQVPALLVGDL